jgi:hypothetical protein
MLLFENKKMAVVLAVRNVDIKDGTLGFMAFEEVEFAQPSAGLYDPCELNMFLKFQNRFITKLLISHVRDFLHKDEVTLKPFRKIG